MILRNPHTEDVSVILDGTHLSVSAGETVEVSADYGLRWKKIHGFLEILESDEVAVAVEPVAEVSPKKETAKEKKAREAAEKAELEVALEGSDTSVDEVEPVEEDEKTEEEGIIKE